MNVSDLPFAEIWLHDFEFIPKPGEHPDVVCLVAHELRSGRTLQLWRDALDKRRGRRPTGPTIRRCSSISSPTPSVRVTSR